MAKGQMRSSREPKKPKKQKVKIAPATSAFSIPPPGMKPVQNGKRQK
jgi:hypothetical protein